MSHKQQNRRFCGDAADELENHGESVTITMPTDNIDQLQHESDLKQVSLNTRINQIIKDHLEWHSYAPQVMSYVPESLVTNAINQLTEQELFEFAQSVLNNFHDMCLLLRGEFNFSLFLDILNIWLKITRTPNRFGLNEHEYKIVIRHDIGYKYSYLIKEVFRYVNGRKISQTLSLYNDGEHYTN